MSRQSVLWVLVVFFGASLAFGALNDVTEGSSTAVRLGVQVAALAVIVAALVLFVRMRDR